MLLGVYKNYEDLETHLTVDELNRMVSAEHKRIQDEHRFAASLKGIKLPTVEEEQDRILREKVAAQAEAKRKGVTNEQYMNEAGLERLKAIGIVQVEG